MLVTDEVNRKVALILTELKNTVRIPSGLTQREFAYNMGTSQGNIGGLETGLRVPNLATLIRYCDAGDCELVVMGFRRKNGE